MQFRFPFLVLLICMAPAAWSKSSQREQAEKILRQKCMDCHSDQTHWPWYSKMPGAKQLIEADVKKGRSYFHLESELFSIEDDKQVPKYVIARLQSVVDAGSMPPLQYSLAHWDKALTSEDKDALNAWLEIYQDNAILPLPDPASLGLDQSKVKLGRKLFHDVRLSGDNTLSCASCHNLSKGGTDQAQVSTGIGGAKGPINSPTVLNSSFNFKQFWDGRAEDLEAQAHGPVHNPIEMGSNWDEVIPKLRKDGELLAGFVESFGNAKITGDRIANAIAEFEKSLVTHGNDFDKYLAGDQEAISAAAKRGYKSFKKLNCNKCHNGPALGGGSFEKMGLEKDYFATKPAVTEVDLGRFNVTQEDSDKHKFKVPVLRNIEDTYPYFHDASAQTLEQAVKLMAEYQLGKKLSKKQISDLVEFLKSL